MIEAHSDLALLIDAIARTQGRLRAAFAPARAGSSLSDMEHTVLVAVVEARRAPTVPQIGRSLGHPRQVIQRAANRLIEAELIAAAPNPDHKRAGLLVPTPTGRALQTEANRQARQLAASLMTCLDPAEVQQATALLTTIRAGIERHEKSRNP
ncbi:MarR family winged helix-turn-helix transcriptional regulator [Novosphingobium sp. FKTRR1]|uniref:MarR family winged helix-turn-helix transcriptional regulator n=1 Tax=Novosphingobium sp. FKTRR1 TaxID=2879118 RepID=UPI001CEFFAA7|nr:helix-turn-helix domain-containing protein [Novosphingobium sp. FKTRR1]